MDVRIFQINDLVYMLGDKKGACYEAPYVNSSFEIDLKVIGIRKNLGVNVYDLMSGKGCLISGIHPAQLIHAREYMEYKGFDKLMLTVDTEVAPKATVFYLDGEYWSNDTLGVYLHKSKVEKLKDLFQ